MNGNKFREICSEDCDAFRVICGKYFPFDKYSLFNFSNHHKLILLLITLHRITLENEQNIKSLTKPIPKNILLIFVFLKNSL